MRPEFREQLHQVEQAALAAAEMAQEEQEQLAAAAALAAIQAGYSALQSEAMPAGELRQLLIRNLDLAVMLFRQAGVPAAVPSDRMDELIGRTSREVEEIPDEADPLPAEPEPTGWRRWLPDLPRWRRPERGVAIALALMLGLGLLLELGRLRRQQRLQPVPPTPSLIPRNF